MKKILIGAGSSIVVIIIANITAQKLVPERALPISVFSACLCFFIPLAISFVMLLIAAIKNLKENKPKDAVKLLNFTAKKIWNEAAKVLKIRYN